MACSGYWWPRCSRIIALPHAEIQKLPVDLLPFSFLLDDWLHLLPSLLKDDSDLILFGKRLDRRRRWLRFLSGGLLRLVRHALVSSWFWMVAWKNAGFLLWFQAI